MQPCKWALDSHTDAQRNDSKTKFFKHQKSFAIAKTEDNLPVNCLSPFPSIIIHFDGNELSIRLVLVVRVLICKIF